jgi:hypothetical protein
MPVSLEIGTPTKRTAPTSLHPIKIVPNGQYFSIDWLINIIKTEVLENEKEGLSCSPKEAKALTEIVKEDFFREKRSGAGGKRDRSQSGCSGEVLSAV